jgi:hypothetical protein
MRKTKECGNLVKVIECLVGCVQESVFAMRSMGRADSLALKPITFATLNVSSEEVSGRGFIHLTSVMKVTIWCLLIYVLIVPQVEETFVARWLS